MKKYIAKFIVPAEVEVTLEVEAADQQEGLVAAHDLIHQALPQGAKVLQWDLERARNSLFEPAPAPEDAQLPGPLDQETGCRVTFSSTREPKAERTLVGLAYAAAYAKAEEVRGVEGSPWGSAVVYDRFGTAVHHVYALRGGWEIEFERTDGNFERQTWLPSREAANTVLRELFSRNAIKSAKLFDYTDRKRGAVLVRSIG